MVLIRVLDGHLQVKNGQEALLEWGPLTVSIHSAQGVNGLWLKVGMSDGTQAALVASYRPNRQSICRRGLLNAQTDQQSC